VDLAESVITDAHAKGCFRIRAEPHVRRVTSNANAIQHNQPALIAFLQTAAATHDDELLFGDNRWVFPGSGYPHQGYAIGLVSQYTAQLLAAMTTGSGGRSTSTSNLLVAEWKSKRNTMRSTTRARHSTCGAAHRLP